MSQGGEKSLDVVDGIFHAITERSLPGDFGFAAQLIDRSRIEGTSDLLRESLKFMTRRGNIPED
jgi:hypothetical protein